MTWRRKDPDLWLAEKDRLLGRRPRQVRFGTEAAAEHEVTDWYNPDSEDSCLFCLEADGSEAQVSDGIADYVVAGYPLCQPHAVREVLDILTSPNTFVHSWPHLDEIDEWWRDAVPFHLTVHMVRPVSYEIDVARLPSSPFTP